MYLTSQVNGTFLKKALRKELCDSCGRIVGSTPQTHARARALIPSGCSSNLASTALASSLARSSSLSKCSRRDWSSKDDREADKRALERTHARWANWSLSSGEEHRSRAPDHHLQSVACARHGFGFRACRPPVPFVRRDGPRSRSGAPRTRAPGRLTASPPRGHRPGRQVAGTVLRAGRGARRRVSVAHRPARR